MPALDPASVFSPAVTAQRWHTKDYVEKVPYMPRCQFPHSVMLEVWKEKFVLNFHFLLKVCFCFVWALSFLKLNRVYFFRIYFLWKQYLCVFWQPQTTLFWNRMKLWREAISLTRPTGTGTKSFLKSEKKCLSSLSGQVENKCSKFYYIHWSVTCSDKIRYPRSTSREGSFQREMESSFL